MKIIFLVLSLAVVVLAAPGDDIRREGRNRGDGYVDGSLKFDVIADGTVKSKFEALAKPITDFLKNIGLDGETKSEGDGKGGGHLTGEFKFGRKRNGRANALLSGAKPESSQGSMRIPAEILSLLPSENSNAKTGRV